MPPLYKNPNKLVEHASQYCKMNHAFIVHFMTVKKWPISSNQWSHRVHQKVRAPTLILYDIVSIILILVIFNVLITHIL